MNCVLEGHVSPQRERLEDQYYWKESVYKIYSVGGKKKKKSIKHILACGIMTQLLTMFKVYDLEEMWTFLKKFSFWN